MDMPVWVQHILVLCLAAGCLAVVCRDAVRALSHQASRLAGCGSCKGCGTQERNETPLPSQQGRTAERVVFLPADALTVRVAAKTGSK